MTSESRPSRRAHRLLADRYERVLLEYEMLLAAHLDAVARLHTLRRATQLLIAASCRVAGEYRIDVRSVPGTIHPLTTPIGALLGTATYQAMEVLRDDA